MLRCSNGKCERSAMLHPGCSSVVCRHGHCIRARRRYDDLTVKAAAVDLEIKVRPGQRAEQREWRHLRYYERK